MGWSVHLRCTGRVYDGCPHIFCVRLFWRPLLRASPLLHVATPSHAHSPTPGPSKAISAFQRRPSAKDLLMQTAVLDAIAQFQTSTWKVPPVQRVFPHQTRVALRPGPFGPSSAHCLTHTQPLGLGRVMTSRVICGDRGCKGAARFGMRTHVVSHSLVPPTPRFPFHGPTTCVTVAPP